MAKELIAGRYRPLERHAIGGMSAIWRAQDEWTGETVAVKRLHPFLVSDPVARERLLREAAALQALDHPSIVRPREVIDDPADPAIVMDFAAGRSLQTRLAESGALEADEAVGIMTAVADALAVAHEAGIVHRDIKPGNILVDESGAVQLVDFGIATVPASAEALTAPQTMVGTLRYAAPERLRGEDATSRSDVWALGAVLYELLTGRLAVPDPGASGTSPGVGELPGWLGRIVERAMAIDPAERYADASAFRNALGGDRATVDPSAATVLVPTPLRTDAPTPESRRGAADSPIWSASSPARWSPVDRAAAGFIAVVALVVILGVAVLGLDGLGPAGGSSVQRLPEPSERAAPAATDAPATAIPQQDDEGGGNGKGKDNGKGKGNGND